MNLGEIQDDLLLHAGQNRYVLLRIVQDFDVDWLGIQQIFQLFVVYFEIRDTDKKLTIGKQIDGFEARSHRLWNDADLGIVTARAVHGEGLSTGRLAIHEYGSMHALHGRGDNVFDHRVKDVRSGCLGSKHMIEGILLLLRKEVFGVDSGERVGCTFANGVGYSRGDALFIPFPDNVIVCVQVIVAIAIAIVVIYSVVRCGRRTNTHTNFDQVSTAIYIAIGIGTAIATDIAIGDIRVGCC